MKLHHVVVGLLAVAAVPALAQQRPDFSGAWVVDTVQAPPAPSDGGRRGLPSGGAPGGRGGGRPQPPPDQGGMRGGFAEAFRKGERISITQTADTLVLVRETDGQLFKYPLDGSEASQRDRSDIEIKSKTHWEGVALVTETTQPAPRGNMTLRTRQLRTLSADGRTMTLVTSVDTPRGPMTTTVTFVKS